jgi:hypothetical protein
MLLSPFLEVRIVPTPSKTARIVMTTAAHEIALDMRLPIFAASDIDVIHVHVQSSMCPRTTLRMTPEPACAYDRRNHMSKPAAPSPGTLILQVVRDSFRDSFGDIRQAMRDGNHPCPQPVSDFKKSHVLQYTASIFLSCAEGKGSSVSVV